MIPYITFSVNFVWAMANVCRLVRAGFETGVNDVCSKTHTTNDRRCFICFIIIFNLMNGGCMFSHYRLSIITSLKRHAPSASLSSTSTVVTVSRADSPYEMSRLHPLKENRISNPLLPSPITVMISQCPLLLSCELSSGGPFLSLRLKTLCCGKGEGWGGLGRVAG